MKKKIVLLFAFMFSFVFIVFGTLMLNKNNQVMASMPDEYETPLVLSLHDVFYKNNNSRVGMTMTNETGRNCYVENPTKENGSVVYRFKWNWETKISGSENFKLILQSADGNNTNTANFGIYPTKTEIYVASGSTVTGNSISEGEHIIEVGRLAILESGVATGSHYYYILVDGNIVLDTTASGLSSDDYSSKYIQLRVLSTDNKNYISEAEIDNETPDVLSISDLKYNKSTPIYCGPIVNLSDNAEYLYDKTSENYSTIIKFIFHKVENENFRLHFFYNNDKWNTTTSVWFTSDNTQISKQGNKYDSFSKLPIGTYNIEIGKLAITYNGNVTGDYKLYYKVDGNLVAIRTIALDKSLMTNRFYFNSGSANYLEDVDYQNEVLDNPDVISISDFYGNPVLSSSSTKHYFNGTSSSHSMIVKFKMHTNEFNGIGVKASTSGSWDSAKMWIQDNNEDRLFFAWTLENTPSDWYFIREDREDIKANETYEVEICRSLITSGKHEGMDLVYIKVDGRFLNTDTGRTSIFYTSHTQNNKANDQKSFYFYNTDSSITFEDFIEETYDTTDVVSLSNLSCNTDHIKNVNNNYTYTGNSTTNSTILKFVMNNGEMTLNQSSLQIGINNYSCKFMYRNNGSNESNNIFFGWDLTGKPIDRYYIYSDHSNLQDNTPLNVEIGRLRVINGVHSGQDLVYMKVNGEYLTRDNHISRFYVDPSNTPVTAKQIYIKSTDIEVQDVNYETYVNYDVVSIKELYNLYALQNITNKSVSFSSTCTDFSTVFKFKVDFGNASTSDASFEMNLSGQVATDWQGCRLKFDGSKLDRIEIGKALSGSPCDYYYFNQDHSNILDNTVYEFEFGRVTVTSGQNAGLDKVYLKVNGNYLTNGSNVSCFYHNHNSITLDEHKVSITSLGCAKIMDINMPTEYEDADHITVNDLIYAGEYQFNRIDTKEERTYLYNSTKEKKSVIFNFVYNINSWSIDDHGSQFRFFDGWNDEGFFWLRPDALRIGYINSSSTSYITASAISTGDYDVEMGRLAIMNDGEATGEYYLYLKINGFVVLDYISTTTKIENKLFITGNSSNNNTLSTPGAFINASMDKATVSTYLTTVNGASIRLTEPSGIRFTSKISYAGYNALVNKYGKDNVKLYTLILPKDNYNGSDYTILNLENAGAHQNSSKGYVLVENNGFVNELEAESDGYYLFYGSLVNMNEANYTRDFYGIGVMCINGVYFYGDTAANKANHTRCISDVAKAAYNDADDDVKEILEVFIKNNLNVIYNGDTENITGASKNGNMGDSTITLTGSLDSYDSFSLNGQKLNNNDIVNFGVYRYKASLGAKTITLSLQHTPTVYGVSDHFKERADAYCDWMTKENVYQVMDDIGLTALRLDIYFSDIFYVDSDDTVRDDTTNIAKIRSIIDYMVAQNPNMEIMAVVWVTQPVDLRDQIVESYVRSIPGDFSSTAYQRFMTLNKNAMKRCAELFPEITAYEPWNEPQFKSQIYRYDGTPFTNNLDVARVLTDLCYNYTQAVKSVNSNIRIMAPSLITGTQAKTGSDCYCYNVEFLENMYIAIKDSTNPALSSANSTNPDDYFEMINLHPYTILGITTSNWSSFVESIHEVCREYGDTTTPLWLTEFGVNSPDSSQNATYKSTMTSLLTSAYNSSFIDHVFFYKGIDQSTPSDAERYGLYNQQMQIKATGTAAKDFIASHQE